MHISLIQAALLGFIQGVTELFPISSLGHAVLVPAWLGGSLHAFSSQNNDSYLSFTVALHLASALALLLVFRRRWFELVSGAWKAFRKKVDKTSQRESARVFWLIVIATAPAGVLGIALQKHLNKIFADAKYAAIFLTINGVVLFIAERLTRKKQEISVKEENAAIVQHISPGTAVAVGVGQSAALFAGISRFGVTTSAGLLKGLSHSVASDFAFLLSLPIIAAAAVVKVPHLLKISNGHDLELIAVGSAISFIGTYFSIKFLVNWFKTRTLYPFAIYCILVGGISIIKFH